MSVLHNTLLKGILSILSILILFRDDQAATSKDKC